MELKKETWEIIKALPDEVKGFIHYDALTLGKYIYEDGGLCFFCDNAAAHAFYGMAGRYFCCEDHRQVATSIGSRGIQYWNGSLIDSNNEIKRIR